MFISSFAGERSSARASPTGAAGKVFYFSPGDQDYPVYHQEEIQRVLANGVRWAAAQGSVALPVVSNPERGWFLKA